MKKKEEKKIVWITGTNGFVGKNLLPLFPKEKYTLYRISNCFKHPTPNSNRIYIDFLDKKHIEKVINEHQIPDLLIHLGWGDVDNPNSNNHITSNVESGKNLIDIFFRYGLKKFVFIGSINEYGEQENILKEEMCPNGKLSNYALGKSMVAKYGLEKSQQYNASFIHIRLFYIYGTMQRKKSLINSLFECYKKKTKMDLGSCDYFRDYIHVSEAVYGIKLLSELNISTTVNLGSGNAIRLKDFVLKFWNQLGGDENMLSFGSDTFYKNEQIQNYCYADLTKLEALIHWKPTLTIEQGIKLTINNLKKLQY